MNYKDQLLTCEQCGKSFVYTVEEQRRQAEWGLPLEPPALCPARRKAAAVRPGLHPGLIKWYSEEKGYGFLIQSDGTEIFFHRSGVTGDPERVLKDGAPVWYEVMKTERGPQAYNVHERE